MATRDYSAEYKQALSVNDVVKANQLLLERKKAIDANVDNKGTYKGDALYTAAQNLEASQQPAAPQAPALPTYQDQSATIGASYDAQLAAQTAKIQATRDQAISDYESQIAGAPETYGAQRAAVDASTARNLQKQNEYAAAKGTAFSGGVASDINATRGQGEQSKVALTQQETNFVQNLRKAIADTRKAASYEEISATANVQSQKAQALAAEAQNVYKAGYQTAQDTFSNQITSQNQALNARQTEAQIAATEANIRQSDAATAASLVQQEMAKIEMAAMKDPNSPENQAKLLALNKAKEELRQLQVSGKYTEAEAKARVDAIWANIRQSNASAANSLASADATRREIKLKEDAANAVSNGRTPTTADIKNVVDSIRVTAGSESSTVGYGQGGATTSKSTSIDVTKALTALEGLEQSGWSESYIREVAAQLGVKIP